MPRTCRLTLITTMSPLRSHSEYAGYFGLRRAAHAALLFLLCVGAAHSASVQVVPVRVEISAQRTAGELRIINSGDKPVSMQVDPREWSQNVDGVDQLAPTEELLAVPPLFTIPPGRDQIVRLGLLGQPSPTHEKTFRLLVTELAPASGEREASAVRIRLQLSIPVFVAPSESEAIPELVVEDTRIGADGVIVTLRNTGNTHVKLKQLSVAASGGDMPDDGRSGKGRYLLPGTSAEIFVPGQLTGALRSVRIETEDGWSREHAVAPDK